MTRSAASTWAAGRSTSEVTLARFNRALGFLFTILGLLLLLAWWTGRSDDRHGMGFVFIGALSLGPIGPLFLMAEQAWRRRWRLRWLLQALPLLYPVGLIAFLAAAFG